MANLQRNFIAGIMNKSLDERLLPNGQYVDALNVRLGSTEETEVGSVENTKGNLPITALEFDGTQLSTDAKCIGAYEDGGNETIYWFVHDPNFGPSSTNKLDLIVSFNIQTATLTYHVISIANPTASATTLNFSPTYFITGVNLVDNNLLFFTDDINPPRFINTERNYPNPAAGFDGFTAEALLVIKKPPITSPDLLLLSTPSQNNFLEDRFVCFGYRYQYADGEFSAPSQFSEPAFIPGPFQFDFGIGLNEGMLNSINLARITYDSGGPLVKAVELLWKDMTNGNIRAIEKINKLQNNIADNALVQYDFSDSKIFTVLPVSEILRLYDNVPRLAKAQTLMGNRLIYGNYLEQYDLITPAGGAVQLNYTLEKISQSIGLTNVSASAISSQYTIQNPNSLQNTAVRIEDVSSLDLVAGAVLDIDLTFSQLIFVGNNPGVSQPITPLNFQFILPRDYSSANDLATSPEFLNRIGTLTTIQPFVDACDGTTLTDEQNCAVLQNLGTFEKIGSGRNFLGEPLEVISSPGSPDIIIGLNAVKYEDPNTGQNGFEYYKIESINITFQSVGDPKTLHSNRNYEIGIIYQDEFNRASNALVSQENTMHIPCEDSITKNRIQIEIPTSQVAPYWAKRYKFCIKQDKEDYFNVYTSFFFTDPTTAATYFLLEGQNAQKVEEGDILQVKVDSNGALQRCAFATVLEKEAKQADFLDPPPTIPGTTTDIPVPGGVYMKMRPNQFSAQFEENAVVNYGQKSSDGGGCRQVTYDLTIDDAANPGDRIAYDIPAGSKIRIVIDNFRRGNEDTAFGNVSQRKWFVDADFTSTSDYTDFKQFFENDNIAAALENQAVTTNVTGPNYQATGNLLSCGVGNISMVIIGTPTGPNADLRMIVKSSEGYSGDKKKTTLKVRIEVIRSQGFIVFETKPIDAVPDVWYISSESYPIADITTCEFNVSVDTDEPNPIQFDYIDIYGRDASVIVGDGDSLGGIIGQCGSLVISPSTPPVDVSNIDIDSFPLPEGAHIGNVQSQFGGFGGNNPAIIDTAFFNAFAFGNGIESYVILDEIAGKELTLGNQVTSTSQQEYQEIRRFADLTYSGVFNDESNVNKLNEFNLGLLNFKPLEEEFGLVMKLDGRETDVLCLQEDKISYVLAGKNLLSDATGGGAVTSVPEVLGTQIARIEEYGISFNPESYAKWGSNKFFTDAKRGAVLQLKGTSAQNEQLKVISEAGMRSWFRDLFIEDFNTQKLGGYDPYMNEYVLSANQTLLPEIVECVECGITRTILISEGNSSQFCVDVGFVVGSVDVSWNVVNNPGADDFELDAEFNGVTVQSGNTAVSGNLTVNKNVPTPSKVNIFVDMVNKGSVELEILVSCPDANSITIIQVCVSLDQNGGEFIHNEYEWTDGVVQSPKTTVGIQLASGVQNPLVSQYNSVVGPQGTIAPTDGATVTLFSNKINPPDNFVFDPNTDSFKFLRSNTLYVNTPGNIANLLAAATTATPITGGGNTYQANFTMPNTGDYLYLIYDYRNAKPIELCYDAFSSAAACCDCGEFTENLKVKQCRADAQTIFLVIPVSFGLQVGDFCELAGYGDCVWEVIDTTPDPTNATVSQARPDVVNCFDLCQRYGISNSLGQAATMQYIDCNGVQQSVTLQPGNNTTLCFRQIVSLTGNLSITIDNCTCDNPGELIFYVVTQCRLDGVLNTEIIQDGSNSLNIGDLISITPDANCVWEVTAIAAGPATQTVNGIVQLRGCSSVCQEYSLTNNTNVPIAVDYVSCSNQATVTTVGAASSKVVCAQDFVSLDPNITIQLNNCECTIPQPD